MLNYLFKISIGTERVSILRIAYCLRLPIFINRLIERLKIFINRENFRDYLEVYYATTVNF